ncbi:hypothetical protein ColTof4_09713 [Colletotrichum tofieldiae]|nr:hypothetical protein ColTof3_05067 [Colletotrichum tofieldiae]GKT77290.1 hypothetical protein ColTof4_09713 [Colletotrichum tofieldiae]
MDTTPVNTGNSFEAGILLHPVTCTAFPMNRFRHEKKSRGDWPLTINNSPVSSPGPKTKYRKSRSWSSRRESLLENEACAAPTNMPEGSSADECAVEDASDDDPLCADTSSPRYKSEDRELAAGPRSSPGPKTEYRKSRIWSPRRTSMVKSKGFGIPANTISLADFIEEFAIDDSETLSLYDTRTATENAAADSLMLFKSDTPGFVSSREHVITEDASEQTHSTPFVEFIYLDDHNIPPLDSTQPEDIHITEHTINGANSEDGSISFVEFIYSHNRHHRD